MSDIYQGGAAGGTGADPQEPSGKVETAKQEAVEVKDTVTQEAGGVLDSAKDEVAAVAGEAKSQIKDLYQQSRQELGEQAAVQQRRVADGLWSVGGELRSMADNSDSGGIGADLVRQTSTKVSAVAEWIGDRDPGSLLGEVKAYARRKPGVFIAVTALAGLAVGRLTRSLVESNADHQSDHSDQSAQSGQAGQAPARTDTPLFDRTDAAVRDPYREGRP